MPVLLIDCAQQKCGNAAMRQRDLVLRALTQGWEEKCKRLKACASPLSDAPTTFASPVKHQMRRVSMPFWWRTHLVNAAARSVLPKTAVRLGL
jgi:hypothetical protein